MYKAAHVHIHHDAGSLGLRQDDPSSSLAAAAPGQSRHVRRTTIAIVCVCVCARVCVCVNIKSVTTMINYATRRSSSNGSSRIDVTGIGHGFADWHDLVLRKQWIPRHSGHIPETESTKKKREAFVSVRAVNNSKEKKGNFPWKRRFMKLRSRSITADAFVGCT